MINLARSAAFGAALLAPVGASAAILDFDTLDASAGQTVPLTSFSEDGYSFDLFFTGNNAGPAIFDTLCTGYGGGDGCNGDADLVPAVQGENGVEKNVMILQSNAGGAPIPNDDANGGRIEFKLTSGPSFFLKGFSGVDEQKISAFDTDGTTLLGFVDPLNDSDTGLATFTSSRINVGDSFFIEFDGSGGIDSLVTAPVPLPAALPMALAAFGALGWVSRRKA